MDQEPFQHLRNRPLVRIRQSLSTEVHSCSRLETAEELGFGRSPLGLSRPRPPLGADLLGKASRRRWNIVAALTQRDQAAAGSATRSPCANMAVTHLHLPSSEIPRISTERDSAAPDFRGRTPTRWECRAVPETRFH